MKCPYCRLVLLVQRTPIKFAGFHPCECVAPHQPQYEETWRCTACDIEQLPVWWEQKEKDLRSLPAGDR